MCLTADGPWAVVPFNLVVSGLSGGWTAASHGPSLTDRTGFYQNLTKSCE